MIIFTCTSVDIWCNAAYRMQGFFFVCIFCRRKLFWFYEWKKKPPLSVLGMVFARCRLMKTWSDLSIQEDWKSRWWGFIASWYSWIFAHGLYLEQKPWKMHLPKNQRRYFVIFFSKSKYIYHFRDMVTHESNTLGNTTGRTQVTQAGRWEKSRQVAYVYNRRGPEVGAWKKARSQNLHRQAMTWSKFEQKMRETR